MSALMQWSRRSFAAAAVLTLTCGSVSAQAGGIRPAPPQPNNPLPKAQPKADVRNPILMPSINTWPGLPAYQMSPPIVGLPDWMNPALDNPWTNQTNVARVRNPLNFAPWFNNPFVLNPLLRNPGNNPFNNPFAVPGYDARFGPEFATATPAVGVTPPVAIRQPGWMMWKRPDLHVNPWSGTVYRPVSGVVTLADGSTFYRVPGTGLPTATGTYATGTGLSNPTGGTYFNPSSGILSKPGQTNVFLPYIW